MSGPIRADPCSSWPLLSAGSCFSCKHKLKDKKQKHQQERGLTAKLCRNQMSFSIACSHPGNVGSCTSLPLGREISPSHGCSGRISVTTAAGFQVRSLHNPSGECGSDVQARLQTPMSVEGDAFRGHWAPQQHALGMMFVSPSSVSVVALAQINLGSLFNSSKQAV